MYYHFCNINLLGVLARDVEKKISSNGKPYLFFLVGKYKYDKTYDNYYIQCFKVFSEDDIAKFSKGCQVAVSGYFEMRQNSKGDWFPTITALNIVPLQAISNNNSGNSNKNTSDNSLNTAQTSPDFYQDVALTDFDDYLIS